MIDIKFIIAGVAAAVIFGSGWWVGYSKYLDYKKEVEIAAKAQEAHVESIQKQHQLVTKGIENEYDAKLALLRQYYANGVRQPNSSSVSNLSDPTKLFDASTAYNQLIGNCAQTTLMLTELQKWINDVTGVK